MPDNDQRPSITTAGLLTLDEFAADISKCMRTVRRYVDRGMPIIRVGVSPFVDPAAARQWFIDGMPAPKTSRGRRRAA